MDSFLDLLEKYFHIFIGGFTGSFYYIIDELSHPFQGNNFFYWMVFGSLLVWTIEVLVPWRKYQKPIRKDFWLDVFYMFFNVYIFSLIGYNAISNVFTEAFNNFLEQAFGITNMVAISLMHLDLWLQLLIFLILRDFLDYFVHRLLHRVPFLWNFHKLHHSSEEMGFAVQMRFHWGEAVVYRIFEYTLLGMIGLSIQNYIIISVFAFMWGHLNHANIPIKLGPLKYILNNPRMHIWHHAKHLPYERRYGANFGLTFSIWDYIFGTAYIPEDGRDIELGFPKSEKYPKTFWEQMKYPFLKKKPDETTE